MLEINPRTQRAIEGVNHCGGSPTSITFVNRCSHNVDVLWQNASGERIKYMTLLPGAEYKQETYVGHVWVVLAGDTILDALAAPLAATGSSSTFRVYPLSHLESSQQEEIHELFMREQVALPVCDAGEYGERGRANISGGQLRIMAFPCVDIKSIHVAAHTIEQMMRDCCKEVCGRLVDRRVSIAVIGRCQVTSDMPPHSWLKGMRTSDGRCFDDGCRGLGATCSVPCTSVGEENCLMLADDKFSTESVLVHEFGHCVMNCGFDAEQMTLVKSLYSAALAAGGHGNSTTYMMSNADEYWAEMTQAWFHATVRTDVNNGIRTRADVKKRDPNMASLLTQIYGDGSWRYTQDCPNVERWGLKKQGLDCEAPPAPHRSFCYLDLLPKLGNFDEIDKDGDGKIQIDELEKAMTKLLGRTPAPTEVEEVVGALKKVDPSNTSLHAGTPYISQETFGIAMRALANCR